MSDTDTIAVIEKNKTTDVRVTLGSWRGQPNFHIRQYETWAGEAMGRKRTERGFTLPIAKLPEMRRAINEAEARAIERGLLPDVEPHDVESVCRRGPNPSMTDGVGKREATA